MKARVCITWMRQSAVAAKIDGTKNWLLPVDFYSSAKTFVFVASNWIVLRCHINTTIGTTGRRRHGSRRKNRQRGNRKKIWHEILCWINFHPFCFYVRVRTSVCQCVDAKSVPSTVAVTIANLHDCRFTNKFTEISFCFYFFVFRYEI